MKSTKRPRKPRDPAVTRRGARRVKGGAIRKTAAPALSPPSPPSGPLPISYPN
jgi:hypothetical protein